MALTAAEIYQIRREVGGAPDDASLDAIFSRLRSRLDTAGILHIVAGESRSQWQNRQAALTRFMDILQAALKPVKKRVKTKVSRAAKQRRIDDKKKHGEKKRMRRIDP